VAPPTKATCKKITAAARKIDRDLLFINEYLLLVLFMSSHKSKTVFIINT
jgi:hypothetical protein